MELMNQIQILLVFNIVFMPLGKLAGWVFMAYQP